MRFWRLLLHHFDAIFLLIVLTSLCFANYSLGTYLIGWDNLMPELSIGMNLKRSLFAAWQEYQGLGLVGGMAHAADLVRQLLLLPIIALLPQSLVRYIWHFSMLYLGSFGVLIGSKKLLRFSPATSLCAALFYLLNFGTIQYFWAPLETFSSFWGFFPWIIFTLFYYLDHPSRKRLIFLIIVNFLASPSFYVQTLFVVYLLCLFLIFTIHFFSHFHRILPTLNQWFKIALGIFTANSFWLLPFLYFLFTNLHNPTSGIGNFMSNEETFARNYARGNLFDFLLLRGYYFDFPDNSGQFMGPWVYWLSNFYRLGIAVILSSFVFIGLIKVIFTKKNIFEKSLLSLFLLSSLALLSAVWPFRELNSLIRSIPLIDQVFRAPFTKFIVPTIFTFSVLSAYGLSFLVKFLRDLKYPSWIQWTPFFAFFLLLSSLSYPAFKGNLISPKMRQTIPQEYFDLFEYFKTKPKTARIANLPQGSFWGWTNYRFGVTGSGFLWYGIEQPILDRAFDAWNLKNEQYYWELTNALQKKDPYLLNEIFSKYSIEYVVFDKNVYFPDEKIYAKRVTPTQDLLGSIPSLKLAAQFKNITVYQTKYPTQPYLISSPPQINKFDFTYQDDAYSLYHNYINSTHPDINFPFIDLFTNRLQSELTFDIEKSTNSIKISSKNQPQIPPRVVPLIEDTNLKINNSPLNPSTQSLITEKEGSFIRLNNRRNSDLLVYNFPLAKLNQSYLVEINYHHLSGLPLEVNAVSDNSQFKYFSTKLDKPEKASTAWFLIPSLAHDDFDSGINLIFRNASLNTIATVNEINSVRLYPIPLNEITAFHQTITQPQVNPPPAHLDFKSSIFFYKVNLSKAFTGSTYLVLPQSYSVGWLAFYLDGFKPVFLQQHSLINNWANAWQLDSNHSPSAIYLIFWPQLLEFLGLILIPAYFILLRRN